MRGLIMAAQQQARAVAPYPTDGLYVWYDPNDLNDLMDDGEIINTHDLPDRSPNGYDAGQPFASSAPSLRKNVYNGNSAIQNSDGFRCLRVAEDVSPAVWSFLHNGNDFTFFVVVQRDGDGTGDEFLWVQGLGTAASNFNIFYRESISSFWIYITRSVSGTTALSLQIPALYNTDLNVITISHNSTRTGHYQFRSNGNDIVQQDRGNNYSSDDANVIPKILGTSGFGSGLSGFMGDMLVYDRLLDNSEISNVESLLMAKYL